MTQRELAVLHEEIDRCRTCEGQVQGFAKPRHLERGDIAKLMIVGQGPGNAELNGARAFAGQSGKTLESWLKLTGANQSNPRQGIYFTSVIKWCHSRHKYFPLMASNCAYFLQRQITLIQPRLVITSGREAYDHLTFSPSDYATALCKPVHTSDYLLLSQLSFDFWLLP
jgi:uracil-DNA glycosylase